jgi:hypothetical protein
LMAAMFSAVVSMLTTRTSMISSSANVRAE